MKKRIIAGIQPTGTLHLGNFLSVFGRKLPEDTCELVFFIADLHAMTTCLPDMKELQRNIQRIECEVSALLNGLKSVVLLRQSEIKGLCELYWLLCCLSKKSRLDKAHSFKASGRSGGINVGRYCYPVLMAADILIHASDGVETEVWVGEDQRQHIEMMRHLAKTLRSSTALALGKKFVIPKVSYRPLIPGTDGTKMSKSKGNTIDIFADDKTLEKQVKSIRTDARDVNDPKDPNKCNLMGILRAIKNYDSGYCDYSADDFVAYWEKRYPIGGFPYSDVKTDLYVYLKRRFSDVRL